MYRFSGKGDMGGLYQEKDIPVLSPQGGVGVCQVVQGREGSPGRGTARAEAG